jgi:VanZ family protein
MANAKETERRMRPFLRYWLPVLLWLGVIFIGSTDLMSAEHTSRIIGPILRWLKPGISDAAIAHAQFFVRKTAHLSEYAILALLLWRAFIRNTRLRTKMSILFILGWGLAIVAAASDEFHQSFVASRTASIRDVMIDAVGALFGLLIGSVFARKGKVESGSQEIRKL